MRERSKRSRGLPWEPWTPTRIIRWKARVGALLEAVLDVNRHVWSVFYGTPTFGASMGDIRHNTNDKRLPFGKHRRIVSIANFT